jgi:hypothetical protein
MSVVDTRASTNATAVPTLMSHLLAGRRAAVANGRPVTARPVSLISRSASLSDATST